MDFRILGPLEIEGPDGPVVLGSTKVRSLLALLLIRAGEVVSAERLIDDLWAGAPPRSAASAPSTLSVQTSRCTGALGWLCGTLTLGTYPLFRGPTQDCSSEDAMSRTNHPARSGQTVLFVLY